MKETDLATEVPTLDALWSRVDRTRPTSTTVTVPKDALVGLLLDHTRMAGALFNQTYRRKVPTT